MLVGGMAVALAGGVRATMEAMDFEVWYAGEYRRVVASIHAACGSREVAEDVASEAFARALERWGRVSAMASPGGWTMVVAVNLLRRRQRRAALESAVLRRRHLPVDTPAPEVSPELWVAVAGLPPRTRLAVALRYVGDLSEAEVAEAMGVAEGTVAATLHRARKQLAESLGGQSHG